MIYNLRLMKKQPSIYKNSHNIEIIYGVHAILAALNNPRRKPDALLCTDKVYEKHQNDIDATFHGRTVRIKQTSKQEIEKLLPENTVHQNMLLYTSKLPTMPLNKLIKQDKNNMSLLILDQVCDPHNIGAVIRSAAAFDIDGIILLKKSVPQNFSTISKTACGGIEHIPIVEVTNIHQTLEALKKEGFWCIALDERASTSLQDHKFEGRSALIFGAEGKGLRPLTKKACDIFLNIPTSGNLKSLNISVAVALSLYEMKRNLTT